MDKITVTFKGLSERQLKSATDRLVAELAPEMPMSGFASTRPTKPSDVKPDSQGVSNATLRSFFVFATDWIRTFTEQRKKANITSDQFESHKEELLRIGWLRQYQADTFKPGGQIQFFWPTPIGIKKLREANARFMQPQGDAAAGANATHLWYQHKVLRYLGKKDWIVEIEQSLSGAKRADIGATKNNGKIRHAFEVLNVGIEKEVTNLKKDIEDGWERVIFCIGQSEKQQRTDPIQTKLSELIVAQLGPSWLEVVDFLQLRELR